jgi:hypothetical protein
VRRAAAAPASLRAWACATPPARDVRQPCTKAVRLKRATTLRLALAKRQRVAVVVQRPRG